MGWGGQSLFYKTCCITCLLAFFLMLLGFVAMHIILIFSMYVLCWSEVLGNLWCIQRWKSFSDIYIYYLQSGTSIFVLHTFTKQACYFSYVWGELSNFVHTHNSPTSRVISPLIHRPMSHRRMICWCSFCSLKKHKVCHGLTVSLHIIQL